ncbi:MAG: cupin domain-containing protein [Pseudomonadota bacterium]
MIPSRSICRAVVVGVVSAVLSTAAIAGACPEDQVLSEPRDLGTVSGEGVQVSVRDTIDLEGWRDMGPVRMRMREFIIAPGGRVPLHSHSDRPSILYFISGVATEHNSLCGVPITHKAGESAAEFGADIVHWWSNESDVPAVLLSVDIIPTK